ncbi:TPA: hypothetical protein DIC62_01435 [Candidatus Nomurabacteria bacterium]|nr:hypothetical protein [Candidatus Nomurabacteria bacterium]
MKAKIKGWYLNKKIQFKKWKKEKIKQFMKSRFLLGSLMLIVGISYTVVFYEIQKLDFKGEKFVYVNDVDVVGSPVAYASDSEQLNGEGEIIADKNIPPAVHEIENETKNVFRENSKIALAVFKTESALNPEAKNYNCRYNGKSQSCKRGDENKAWSVDCGIAQINVIAKECPAELFDYKNNIKIAKEMFDRRGFQPWVTYNEGYYLANL